jgi:S-adenosyl methyltransferase
MTEIQNVPPGVDPTTPTSARLYDYILGGTNNYPVDRELAEQLKAITPDVAEALWANRGFHGRAAVWMARQGIRQFIDIGSGLPTQNNTHESVHRLTPDARVVYVDIDPMVAAHSAALLAGDGTTAVIMADLRDPDAVLAHPELRRLIDFTEPAGVLMTSVMHFVADGSDPWGLVARYMAAMAPGSYLALSHATFEGFAPRTVQEANRSAQTLSVPANTRSRAEVERFFDGLELVSPYEGAAPALSFVGLWGAEDLEAADSDGSRGLLCGVARRPESFGRSR